MLICNRLLIWRNLQLTNRATRKYLNMSVQFSSPSIKEAASAAVISLGYKELKEHQARVIEEFVSGHDVFGILPTGYGKSLCYVCLPLVFDQLLQRESGFSIVLIVSPLKHKAEGFQTDKTDPTRCSRTVQKLAPNTIRK